MNMFAIIALTSTLAALPAYAQSSVVIKMQLLDAKGNQDVGEVTVTQTKYGLVFTPNLHGLPEGLHGFHIHENPSCEPAEHDGAPVLGLGAGGHWDPKKTKKHLFPWSDDGHLGDLPALFVAKDGTATSPVLAPRLKALKSIAGRALMVHAGGDNHSDNPAPLGGGGHRMVCGVIK